MPTPTTSTRKGHFQTRSFSSTFGSSPSSPENPVLPLSNQDSSPPLTPASPSRPTALPLLRSVRSVRFGLVLRALGSKAKLIMRGNVLLMIVFFTCLLVFLGALSGTGYQGEDELVIALSVSKGPVQLDVSLPPVELMDESERGLSQRELEELWRKMGRGEKDGAWLKMARDKRENRRIAPVPVAVKNAPKKLFAAYEEEEEEEEELKVVAVADKTNQEPVRVIKEEDRKARVVDIFDYTGHEFGAHEEGAAPGDDAQAAVVQGQGQQQQGKKAGTKPKVALVEIVGGQTKEDI